MTEFNKMLKGLLYNPTCDELIKKRTVVRNLTYKYNLSKAKDIKKRTNLLHKILGGCGKNICIEPTIKFDYGINTFIGDNFFANFDCKILDVCKVTIGNNVMLGSSVTIATPCHPLVAEQRIPITDENGCLYELEYGKPVIIEDNVWISSNVTICGGVKIGKGCVIGAGSIVTRNITENTFAVGNPCKVIRAITDKDYIKE